MYGCFIWEAAFCNALLRVSHTRSGRTSASPLFFPLRIHGRKQEVTEPFFFLSSRAAKKVKRGGHIRDPLGGTFVGTCRFRSWFLCPTTLLIVCFLCQLDADGILWVPYPLPSQHGWEQEHLRKTVSRCSYIERQLLIGR